MKGKINLIEGFGFLFGIANNRKISLERGRQQQVQTLDIPPQGLVSYLPQFGYVTVFQQKFKEESRYYVVCLPKPTEGESEPTFNSMSRQDFENLHDTQSTKCTLNTNIQIRWVLYAVNTTCLLKMSINGLLLKYNMLKKKTFSTDFSTIIW